ncbi:SpoIIE family protein phosphatase [Streptomyces sp. NBC_00572]|uniref:SpoIIE family protein phosphatase n=1 Tax=Streptomyces sp. NBC_00572 TaxID=2903664 RepID=UPI0022583B54|nr:SpoIIE family protein phosphatase [Streptomyces sp. NBC_00572]MCX4986600.1 SpoIIE family protein phosphatase [Streptomyces sp. NBC_00572]
MWDEAILDAVFAQSDVGLHVLDTDLRIVRVNAVTLGLLGVQAERMVGLPAAEAYAPVGVRVDGTMLREVLATGRPVIERLVTSRPPADPQSRRVFSQSAHRLEDRAGHALGVVVTSTNVTERERAQDRLRLLHSARERIGSSLDVERTARELVDVTVPDFADWAVVALTDAVLQGKEPGLQAQDSVPLLRCAAAGSAGGDMPVPEAGAILLPGVFGDALSATASSILSVTGGRDTGTGIAAPLAVRGQIFGAVAFHRPAGAEPYRADDLDLVDGMAARTVTCLENALRFTREHIVMTALQSWPLRPERITQRAVEVAQRHRSGGRGAGSWFDVIPLPGARVALVVGQVEHAGLSSVATMSRLRTAVNSLTTLDLDPHELLARLHATTLRLAAEQDDPSDAGVPTASCTIAVHDPVGGRLDIARAGRSLFVVVHPDGTVDTEPVDDGPLLGAEGPPFACSSHFLPAGSILCMASAAASVDDGPSTAAVVNALVHPERTPEAMADDVDRLLAPDRVLLVARTRHLPPSELAEWTVPFDFSAVATARSHVESRLRQWGHPADAFTATLVASELVTNAIRYGAAPITLRLIADSAVSVGLICEVSDAGAAAPHLRHARAVDEGGRGLLICATVAENWGVRYADDGKTVWAEI